MHHGRSFALLALAGALSLATLAGCLSPDVGTDESENGESGYSRADGGGGDAGRASSDAGKSSDAARSSDGGRKSGGDAGSGGSHHDAGSDDDDGADGG